MFQCSILGVKSWQLSGFLLVTRTCCVSFLALYSPCPLLRGQSPLPHSCRLSLAQLPFLSSSASLLLDPSFLCPVTPSAAWQLMPATATALQSQQTLSSCSQLRLRSWKQEEKISAERSFIRPNAATGRGGMGGGGGQ